MIIATRCLDFFFFFNEDNRRYTIGTFSGIGHYRGTIYKFDYKVLSAFVRVSYLCILPGKRSVSKPREIPVSHLFQSIAAVFVVPSYMMLLRQAARPVADEGILPS